MPRGSFVRLPTQTNTVQGQDSKKRENAGGGPKQNRTLRGADKIRRLPEFFRQAPGTTTGLPALVPVEWLLRKITPRGDAVCMAGGLPCNSSLPFPPHRSLSKSASTSSSPHRRQSCRQPISPLVPATSATLLIVHLPSPPKQPRHLRRTRPARKALLPARQVVINHAAVVDVYTAVDPALVNLLGVRWGAAPPAPRLALNSLDR